MSLSILVSSALAYSTVMATSHPAQHTTTNTSCITPTDHTLYQKNAAQNLPLRSDFFSERPLTRQRKIRPSRLRSIVTNQESDISTQNNDQTEEIHVDNNTEALMDGLRNTIVTDSINTLPRTPSCCNGTPSYRFETRFQHGARQTRLSISFDFFENIRGRIGKMTGINYPDHFDSHNGDFSHGTEKRGHDKDSLQGENYVGDKHQLANLFQQKTINNWIDTNPRLFGMTVI